MHSYSFIAKYPMLLFFVFFFRTGGWHVLKEYSASEWDTYKTLTTLHSHYDVSPFFQISVVSDIVNTKQNVVQVLAERTALHESYLTFCHHRTSPSRTLRYNFCWYSLNLSPISQSTRFFFFFFFLLFFVF